MREYLFITLVAALVTYAATPLARELAVRSGAYTQVRQRDVHSVPIPRLGGIGILAGFLAAALVASRLPYVRQVFDTSELRGIVIAAVIVALVGAVDDIRELDWLTKLAGQLVAAGVMAYHGVQFFTLPFGQQIVLPASVLVALTILVVLVSTNAVNFIDGLDGLAAGVVAIASGAFFLYAYLVSRTYDPPNVFTTAAFVSAALLGCTLGFLPHNVYPARLFMGDSGALLLGLLLAAASISLTGSVSGADVSTNPIAAGLLPLAVPIGVMLLPLVDVGWAVIRRTRAGVNPWQADAGHLHHRMLMIGHGHRRAVLILWSWALAVAAGSVSFVFLSPGPAIALLVAMVVGAAALTIWVPRAGGTSIGDF